MAPERLPAPIVPDAIAAALKVLPDAPGVYLFSDSAGKIIYVGKATHLRGARVLLTDDNAINRQVVRLFLQPQGAVITEATNGREALDALSRAAPVGWISVDAAKAVGVEIPIFCYEPRLGKPIGACRMCLVEVEGMRGLQTACSTPVAPDMVVNKAYGPYQQVGPEVIVLEGPNYVYLPSQTASDLSLGEFWRDMNVANLKDHKLDNYIRRLDEKLAGSHAVAYNARENYAAKQKTVAALKSRQ